MRILVISRCPPYPLHLGDRLILFHLARELGLRGHTLDLLAFYDRDADGESEAQAPYTDLFDHVTLIREQPRTALQYLHRLLWPGMRFPRRAGDCWSPAMWRAIRSRLTTYDYDVAHVFGGVQVYEFAEVLRGLPTVITPYESFSLYLQRQLAASQIASASQFTLRIQQYVARAYEAFMFMPFGRVVVLAAEDKAALLENNPRLSIKVIPNGIDLDYFQPQPTSRETATLLFTGNFEYAPNVDAALFLAQKVLPGVRQKMPQVKLWLVGHGPPPEICALASDVVTITGRVDDMRPYLAKAALFACPLRFGAGIKNKVLEAMAMTCPVVATPLSVDGIGVRSGQEVVLAEVDVFTDTIIRLLQDEDLQEQVGARGRALVEAEYSWAHVAQAYERLFEEVCQ